jgi:hypothetical protein
MKKSNIKSAAFGLLASLFVAGAAQAADPGHKPPVMQTPTMGIPISGGMPQMGANCPAPYEKSTAGFDVSKGEFQCVKSAATCPDAYDSQRNDMTGQLTCTLKQVPAAPLGWAPGVGGGKLVYDSIPQPMINCPKSTPTWQWGTAYFKESWNRMGCRANLKPAS